MRINFKGIIIFCALIILAISNIGVSNKDGQDGTPIPDEILKLMNKPRYSEATWSLRVVDLNTDELIYKLNPDLVLLTGSLRKTFSVGTALNELGAGHRFATSVHSNGEVDADGVPKY